MTPAEIRDRTLHRCLRLSHRAKVLVAKAEILANQIAVNPALRPFLDDAIQAASAVMDEAQHETDYLEYLNER